MAAGVQIQSPPPDCLNRAQMEYRRKWLHGKKKAARHFRRAASCDFGRGNWRSFEPCPQGIAAYLSVLGGPFGKNLSRNCLLCIR